MITAIVSYATTEYEKQQNELFDEAVKEGFSIIRTHWRWELEQTNLYKEYKTILDMKRGVGCCLWKPYYILDALNKVSDVIVYVDCGDQLKPGFRDFIIDELRTKDQVFVANTHINKHHTKRDCFQIMNCDSEEYWDHPILEAGIIAFRNTAENRKFVEEWLYWCTIPDAVVDEPGNQPNFYGYTNHKCDQSILTNLVIKHGLPTTPIQKVMQYVNFNQRG